MNKMYEVGVSKILLTIVILAIFADVGVKAQDQRKCAKYGEYCQEHWECCSKSCLTYSYRCVGDKNPQAQLGVAAAKPSMTLEQLLEVYMQPTDTKTKFQYNQYNSILQPKPQKPSMTFEELLDLSVPNAAAVPTAAPLLPSRFAEVSAAEEGQQTEQAAAGQQPNTAGVVVGGRSGEEEPARESGQAAQSPTTITKCKEIGEKCYRNDECCTKLCHGFLHQCVT